MPDADLIMDVGMHLGEDAEFYLLKGFRVIGIEANPELCEKVRKRLARFVETGQLVIVDRAIAESPGRVKFFVNERNSVWGTVNPSWAERNRRQHNAPSREITVDAVTFGSILSRYGIPYYLKIDIEGSDDLCLRALCSESVRPMFVSIETSILSFDALFEQIVLLRSLGYRRFKIVQQRNIARTKPPFPSREKAYVRYRFPDGASGLFGHELPGAWLDTEAVMRRYAELFPRYRVFGHDRVRSRIVRALLRYTGLTGGWHDLHAMRD